MQIPPQTIMWNLIGDVIISPPCSNKIISLITTRHFLHLSNAWHCHNPACQKSAATTTELISEKRRKVDFGRVTMHAMRRIEWDLIRSPCRRMKSGRHLLCCCPSNKTRFKANKKQRNRNRNTHYRWITDRQNEYEVIIINYVAYQCERESAGKQKSILLARQTPHVMRFSFWLVKSSHFGHQVNAKLVWRLCHADWTFHLATRSKSHNCDTITANNEKVESSAAHARTHTPLTCACSVLTQQWE